LFFLYIYILFSIVLILQAQIDVAEAEKRYLDEAKSYVAKNNELTKLQNGKSCLNSKQNIFISTIIKQSFIKV